MQFKRAKSGSKNKTLLQAGPDVQKVTANRAGPISDQIAISSTNIQNIRSYKL